MIPIELVQAVSELGTLVFLFGCIISSLLVVLVVSAVSAQLIGGSK